MEEEICNRDSSDIVFSLVLNTLLKVQRTFIFT